MIYLTMPSCGYKQIKVSMHKKRKNNVNIPNHSFILKMRAT